ncbi:MAG TPA: hypothetical protein VK852_06320 [Desulfobacterales bacterium]|jgi:hypothetical protein|nr:hypothetical protein [Desulfobacterales bacterium]
MGGRFFLTPVLLTTLFVFGYDAAGKLGDIHAAAARIIAPCEVISRGEAEDLLGITLQEGETTAEERVGFKACIYQPAGDPLGPAFQITITQQAFMAAETLASGTTPESIFQSIRYNFEDELLPQEIGDDAFIAPPGLHLLIRGYYITIAVGNTSSQKNREILQLAGAMAVDKVKKIAP